MSEITGNRYINDALDKISQEGFKKHRRALEIFSGTVIILNLIGADFMQSNPLGISLENAERPKMLYGIIIVIGTYLFFRYTVALNVYLRKHIRDYIQDKNTNLFLSKTLPKISIQKTLEENKIDKENVCWIKTHPRPGAFKYGLFQLVPKNRNRNEDIIYQEHNIELWRRVLPNLKHWFLLHFKDSAIGWDLWMPYYLFIIAIISIYYNYF